MPILNLNQDEVNYLIKQLFRSEDFLAELNDQISDQFVEYLETVMDDIVDQVADNLTVTVM